MLLTFTKISYYYICCCYLLSEEVTASYAVSTGRNAHQYIKLPEKLILTTTRKHTMFSHFINRNTPTLWREPHFSESILAVTKVWCSYKYNCFTSQMHPLITLKISALRGHTPETTQ